MSMNSIKAINSRSDILNFADKCVTGKREEDYGTPENNFKVIADYWNTYLGIDKIAAKDVAMMMALLKIARIQTGKDGHVDSYVDLAGYAACGGEIATHNSKQVSYHDFR